MADALLSPAVGGTMIAVSAGALALAVKKSGAAGTMDEKKVPLMGIMGAFVFAAQMINFTIPATGSSGHIGGGILLAALLGPWAALITLAAVLLIQCLFFADGGLLAYGCNVFNMGVLSSLIAYFIIYKPLIGKKLSAGRLTLASLLAVIGGLQLGAFFVVVETALSGVTELPFASFALLMQPIHLAIALVEGVITAAVLVFVYRLRPEIIENAAKDERIPLTVSIKKVLVSFVILAAITAGMLSLFASAWPDGLEWSMENVAGTAELERESAVHSAAGDLVSASAFMPDYAFKGEAAENPAGTAAAGLAGSAITILLAGGAGLLIASLGRRRGRPAL
ncbi:MAG: energy-coupling factor ABC transporter permease [Treponema sp.]|nr:energy-coupling factor ABC transporter permease [Treponema sp.]